MADLKVELDRLRSASRSWSTEVATGLRKAATSIDELKYSAIQFGLFLGAWQSYSAAAVYVQDRLREGGTEADEVAAALLKVADTYEQQQAGQSRATTELTGDMEFTI
ncbi:hypothetical protein IU418_22920 [Nocardia farcinica]|uniref:hypothetical protein n=1 Tax=Nocardia farcinica TaxID=37329 RepID=UPI001B3C98A1|nr:hypothetical protein [Nocardia farcinica]MBF6540059.1 hypothetical protein [Nocardia farcinica]